MLTEEHMEGHNDQESEEVNKFSWIHRHPSNYREKGKKDIIQTTNSICLLIPRSFDVH